MPPIHDQIKIAGAREHNLRDVSLTLPKGKLICFTGVSGSGKSSLAFDTIYAEGQRRYIESLSSYARQFLGELPKPDVDQITGLSPSISIQQKATGWNPRSTVGTITQIHDYLRVLFARAGAQHCPQCGQPISAQTREHMLARILSLPKGTRFTLLAPKIRGAKGEYKDLFAELVQQGFVRARVDGEWIELSNPPQLDRYRRHDIDVVIDRLIVNDAARARIAEALEMALNLGNGSAIVAFTTDESAARTPQSATRNPQSPADDEAAEPAKQSKIENRKPKIAQDDLLLASGSACTTCGLSFEPPHPQMFSFNSPQGMCPRCDGLGTAFDFDPDLLIPDKTLSFLAPCIAALRTAPGKWRRHIYQGVADHLGISLETPWKDLPRKARQALLYGTGDEHITFEWRSRHGVWKHGGKFEGVIAELREKHGKAGSEMIRKYYEQFMRQSDCSACKGARLNPAALAVKLTAKVGPGASHPNPGRESGGTPAPRGASSDSGPRTAHPNPGRQSGGSQSPPSPQSPPDLIQLNIHQVCDMQISRARDFFNQLELDAVGQFIAIEPLKEIRARLGFLLDVGLDYLTLNRSAPTLSGGESQRIRLASQIGSGLVGVLYVLDEPSIGLHPRDNKRLLDSLIKLRDMGNTVIVVEHDRDTMEAADLIVDFGPGPGVRGGHVVAQGDVAALGANKESLTGAYLSGRSSIETPKTRRPVKRPVR